ncbi:MAG TPA: zf-HC2 domain-containing protein [Burkholderiaceae bacterium]|nr:zf-HC2 domain-containing protein [Burkholderiaceae bacterium]
MSGRIVDFSGSAHRHAQELLPWYLTGTLDEDQHAVVQAHLRSCSACQLDLQWERRLQQACRSTESVWDADCGFAQVQRQLNASDPWVRRLLRRARLGLRRIAPSSRPWIGYAALAQLAAIALLIGLLIERSPSSGEYRTLGAAPAAPANILVVFDSNLRERDLERILRGVGARIAGGPNATGGYLVAVDPARQVVVLQALRSEQGVRLAEPMQLGASP